MKSTQVGTRPLGSSDRVSKSFITRRADHSVAFAVIVGVAFGVAALVHVRRIRKGSAGSSGKITEATPLISTGTDTDTEGNSKLLYGAGC